MESVVRCCGSSCCLYEDIQAFSRLKLDLFEMPGVAGDGCFPEAREGSRCPLELSYLMSDFHAGY